MLFLSPLQKAGPRQLERGKLSGPAALHPCREWRDPGRDPRLRREHLAAAGLQPDGFRLVSLASFFAAGALFYKLVKKNLKHVH